MLAGVRNGKMIILLYFVAALCVQGIEGTRNKRFLFANTLSSEAEDTGTYQWSKWSHWSACNGTCQVNGGHGIMYRSRHCNEDGNVVALHFCREPNTLGGGDGEIPDAGVVDVTAFLDVAEDGSVSSSEKEYEIQACTAPGCIVNVWGDWGSWARCSVSCGVGFMSRSRQCTTGSDCIGERSESSSCTQPSCAIDGWWSGWTEFGECSTSCGNGVHFRTRQCNNPAPQNGGQDCSGSSHEFKACTNGLCPLDGGWSNFTDIACSATCGLGVQTSYRTCTNPSPANGGKNCTGASHKFAHCKLRDCSVDGSWSNWSEWSTCPANSGIGLQTRTRDCTNPSPANGGRNCSGDAKEDRFCVVNKWSEWSSWSNCSVSCGNGIQNRTRTCISENDCVGESTENVMCEMTRCLHVVDGSWNEWGTWSKCSNTCGNGTQIRMRLCNNPVPKDGGLNCTGTNVETVDCNEIPCPIDGGWSEFQNLSCSVTCGHGTLVSIRACNNPSPQFGGNNCVGLFHEKHECNLAPCTIDGGWSEWSPVGSCNSICGDGYASRYRTCSNPAPENGGNNCTGGSEERLSCSRGLCPSDIPTCDKNAVLESLKSHATYSPTRKGPCSNMDYIPQEIMLKTMCAAPADSNVWDSSLDVRTNCERIPLFSPIVKVHRQYSTRNYGIILSCYSSQLKIATETCVEGVHEEDISLDVADEWDYYTMKW